MLTRSDFLLETTRAAAHDDVRCFVVVFCSHNLKSAAHDARERVAVSPDEKQFKNSHNDCWAKSLGRHQNVKEPDVHDHGAKDRQTQRNKPADQQKQAPDDLKPADRVNVAAGKKRVQIFTNKTRRWRRHRNEMQKCVRTKDEEDEPEKNSSNDGSDF